jgi:hypothetical protein
LVLFSQPTTKVVAMRLALSVAAVLAALVCTPVAGAWSWPAEGAVLQPFVFDPAHPYAAGEHRGLDIAGAAGSPVHAPRAGVVAFAGSVPGSGTSLTIATTDGYSVTLTHLGALAVAKGAAVGEGDVVAMLGAAEGEQPQPYLHLGVRRTAEAQGYVDPASLLPARGAPSPPPVPQPPATAPSPVPHASAPVAAPAPAPVPQSPVEEVPPAVPATAPLVVPAVAEPVSGAAADGPGLVIRAAARPAATVPVTYPSRAVAAARVAPVPTSRAPRPTAVTPRVVATAAHVRPTAQPTVVPPVRRFDPRRDPLVAEHPVPRAVAAPIAPVHAHPLPLVPLALVAAVLAGAIGGAVAASTARSGGRKAARMMGRHVDDEPTEDLGGAGLALRSGVPGSWPRGGVRAVRRVRALSPLERERRPRGERNRRARYARDGRG